MQSNPVVSDFKAIVCHLHIDLPREIANSTTLVGKVSSRAYSYLEVLT